MPIIKGETKRVPVGVCGKTAEGRPAPLQRMFVTLCKQRSFPQHSTFERGPSGGAMGAPRSGRSDLSEWQRSAEGEEACRRRQMLGTATGRQPASRRRAQKITGDIFVRTKIFGSLVGELHEAPAPKNKGNPSLPQRGKVSRSDG